MFSCFGVGKGDRKMTADEVYETRLELSNNILKLSMYEKINEVYKTGNSSTILVKEGNVIKNCLETLSMKIKLCDTNVSAFNKDCRDNERSRENA